MTKIGFSFSLSFLLLHILVNVAQSREFAVSSDPPTDCPSLPPTVTECKTLQEFVLNSTDYFLNDTIFHFLPGAHKLDIPLRVSAVDTLALVANTSQPGDPVVQCSGPAYLRFVNSSNITLEGLAFHDCGGGTNEIEAALQFDGVVSTHIAGLIVVNSSNIGLLAHNVDDMSFTGCTFADLPAPVTKTILAHHLRFNFDNTTANNFSHGVRITDCHFNSTKRGAIHINIQWPPDSASLYIDNITTHGIDRNPLVLGVEYRATIFVEMNSTLSHTIEIINSQLYSSLSRAMIFMLSSNGTIRIRKCTIMGSNEGALALYVGLPELTSLQFIIEDSEISNSSLVGDTGAGSAILAVSNNPIHSIRSPVYIRRTVFSGNVHVDTLGLVQSTVYLADMTSVSLSDCRFHSNQATAILAARSTVFMAGHVEFINNSGYQGGALALYGFSRLTVTKSNTHLSFTQNSASNVGGAIYVLENFVPYTQPFPNPCFFRIEEDAQNLSFVFVNNTAVNGGNAIYGESIENCSSGSDVGSPIGGQVLAWPAFSFEPDLETDISVITSDPSRVCMCENGWPDCRRAHLNASAIPGEPFTMSLVTVGQRFGAVSGSVYASFVLEAPGNTYHIAQNDRVQATDASQCKDISFTVSSSDSSAVLALTSQNVTVPFLPHGTLEQAISHYNSSRLIQEILLYFPVFVNVTFLPCPLGSTFSNTSHMCQCDPRLLENDVFCNISNQTVMRPANLWVNASFDSNGEYIGVIVHSCRLQYCIPTADSISLENPNSQCAFNHAGTLCGGCRTGLSLTLGPPTCKHCSDNFLSLLLFFAVAGFALVFFIKILNLTVSEGTINGLIFYANIVWANRALFFEAGETTFQSVFIAWLNLDLGIKTCFYDGLNMYSLTWLQYVFPAYIWLLAIFFIVLAHYSSLMSRLLGGNSVPVLATLFLLTYNKILRNIINTINLTRVEIPGAPSKLVWTHDGNLNYLDSNHVFLFIVALFVLIVGWLPYTGLLLFGPCLLKLPYYKITSKLKPFLDAYYGPLLDNRRYWVGLLLLLRSIILLIFALNPLDTQAIDLLVILLTAVILLYILTRWGYLYRNKYKAQLETSFFLNLATLAGVQLYIEIAGRGRRAAIEISVIIVFIKFLLILLYHAYSQLRRYNRVKRFEVKVKKRFRSAQEETRRPVTTISISESLRIESTMPSLSSNDTSTTPSNTLRRYITRTVRGRHASGHQNTPPTADHTPQNTTAVGYSVVHGDTIQTKFEQVSN